MSRYFYIFGCDNSVFCELSWVFRSPFYQIIIKFKSIYQN
nr:unnamed protein product [Callosobruchus chinensis]